MAGLVYHKQTEEDKTSILSYARFDMKNKLKELCLQKIHKQT